MMDKFESGATPSSHPRADDLIRYGAGLARTLGDVTRWLEVLDQEFRRGRGLSAERGRDAMIRLLSLKVLAETEVRQFHDILADLDGEGYAYLHEDGTGVPYFTDDDFADDDGCDAL